MYMYIKLSLSPSLPPPPPPPLQLHTLRQEHGKVRALNMKLKAAASRAESELEQISAERRRAVEEQRSGEEARRLRETRLQATVSQQTKLIDYLRSAASPPSGRSRFRLKKARRRSNLCFQLFFSLYFISLLSVLSPFLLQCCPSSTHPHFYL